MQVSAHRARFRRQDAVSRLGSNMLRRDFIIRLVGSAAALWPFTAQSQQAKGAVRIGFLFFGSPTNAYDRSLVDSFRLGLSEVGLIDGRDVVLDVEWISD